ncbi:hypothetical protein Bca52824_084530 [Brassica carinata]|uniref:Glutamate receptor n=1 Tax=Brassica carinata TaxID=52824 RepID=A0A8X7PRL2_BRACI|nr:hypothetical protein Bca52824_084530 [Brassica carinata]
MSFSNHIVSRSLPIWLFIFLIFLVLLGKSQKEVLQVRVGVVLDTNSTLTDLSLRAINMSLSEFYNTHNGFKTKIVLSSTSETPKELRKVVAIIGPGSSMQAPFLINLGNQSQVPIVSFSATSPLLDSLRSPYFIRPTHEDSAQVHAISAIIESFRWREVVTIYVDNEFGEDILPYLVDAFQEINVRIRYRSAISLHASDDQIKTELYRLMTMPTRVFIVHMLPDPLGKRLFSIAREIGMINKGYAWIVTNGITDLMGGSSLEDMHGVVGVKTYFSRSKELAYLESRWRKRFGGEKLTHFGYWAYDTATALAMSFEQISNVNMSFSQTKNISGGDNGTDLDDLGVALSGPKLLQALSTVNFKGVGGRFLLKNRKLEPTTFKIINIEESGERTVGFWKSKVGLVKRLGVDQIGTNISHSSRRPRPIIWPGDTTIVPKGWEIPTNGKKLRIAVPKKDGFNNFVKVTKDANTNALTITGFCIDVFDAVMRQMPYAVPYEYVSFETPDGKADGNYDKMVHKVFLGEFDGAVGDTTILANRSNYVDFALPYSETGVVFVVPVKDEREKGEWVFLKPLTKELWFTIAAAFIYIGIMGSFTFEKLTGFQESRLKIYNSPEEMREFFLKTSSNGGIDAAFDEVPYVKLFMAKYCSEYTIIEPRYKADGFGFAFPLGSPLVPDISRHILNLTEGETMRDIETKWFVGEQHCVDRTTSDSPIQLDLRSLRALFMIVFGISNLLSIMLSRRYQRTITIPRGRGDMSDPPNNPEDDHLLLLLLMLASRIYQQRRGNIIVAKPNPPGNGPDGQDNARPNQNRDVNEGGQGANETGGAAEPADTEHRIVEVHEGVNFGDGDHEANRIGKVNLELQRQQSQVRRRCNKLFSEKNMPLGMAAPPRGCIWHSSKRSSIKVSV